MPFRRNLLYFFPFYRFFFRFAGFFHNSEEPFKVWEKSFSTRIKKSNPNC
ncbi:hypothetical protein LEP1GSC053_2194 [Leptospira interrogans serovar Muenchen str. Brem 129]|nr:hypothetical protein LEP1GSC053_2194 [Leptospira interrogans serovar Muenchen str. Brem 129]